MPIYKDGVRYRPYKGNRGPAQVYHEGSKIEGWHEESSSLNPAMFTATYNDTADAILYGNTVQSSDWYAKDGLSTQYQDTKTMGKNLVNLDVALWENGTVIGNVGQTVESQKTSVPSTNRPKNKLAIPVSGSTAYTVSSPAWGIYELALLEFSSADVITAYRSMGTGNFTVTTQATTAYVMPLIRRNDWADMLPAELLNIQIQIEKASSATSYEPYKDRITNGLVMELSGRNFFNDPQTTTLQDRSGNGNVGTPSGFAYTTASGSDGAGGIKFDGVDDKITVTRPVADDFTLECFFKTTQGIGTANAWYLGAGLMDCEVSGINNDFGMSINALGKISIGVGVPGSPAVDKYLVSASGYNNGVIHQAVYTRVRSTGEIKLYIDGVFINSMLTGNFNSLTSATYMNIGSIQTNMNYLNGTIYSARIYNRALSASEVYQNYFAGTNLNVPSPTDASPVVSNLKAGNYKYTSTDGIYEFTLPEDLRGIGTTLDKIVFDRVSHNAVIERRCAKNIFDGSIDEFWSTTTPTTNTIALFTNIPTKANTTYYVDKFKYIQDISDSEHTRNGYGSASDVVFYINKSRLATQDVSGFRSWLSLNPITLVYELITPTRTPITFTKVSSSSRTEVPMTFLTATPSLDYPAQVYDVTGNVVSRGKNLIDYLSTTNQIIDPLTGNVGSNANWRLTGFHAISSNATFRLSQEFPEYVQFKYCFYDSSYSFISGVALSGGSQVITITSPNNAKYIKLNWSVKVGEVNINRGKIQLELGSVPSSYEPYVAPNQSTLPTLRKIGTVKDEYNPKTGKKLKKISDWVTLDGSKSWVFNVRTNTYVEARLDSSNLPNIFNDGYSYLYNYKSVKLTQDGGVVGGYHHITAGGGSLYIKLTEDDFGIGRMLNPSTAEIKAYFYGWKMCNADGTAPYYKSEVPYTPSTWAEWGDYFTGVTREASGVTLTSQGTNYVGIFMGATIKANTKYGVIYNVVGSTVTGTVGFGNAFNYGAMSKTIGNNKAVYTSVASPNQNIYIFNQLASEPAGNYIKLKDICIFELPTGSQIEADFTNLTADQLVAKYTFNGLCTKNWKHVTDGLGITSVLPTASYSGYTPYKMIYQLATPVEEDYTPGPLPTYYPTTVVETDCVTAVPEISITVKVEDD